MPYDAIISVDPYMVEILLRYGVSVNPIGDKDHCRFWSTLVYSVNIDSLKVLVKNGLEVESLFEYDMQYLIHWATGSSQGTGRGRG